MSNVSSALYSPPDISKFTKVDIYFKNRTTVRMNGKKTETNSVIFTTNRKYTWRYC